MRINEIKKMKGKKSVNVEMKERGGFSPERADFSPPDDGAVTERGSLMVEGDGYAQEALGPRSSSCQHADSSAKSGKI